MTTQEFEDLKKLVEQRDSALALLDGLDNPHEELRYYGLTLKQVFPAFLWPDVLGAIKDVVKSSIRDLNRRIDESIVKIAD